MNVRMRHAIYKNIHKSQLKDIGRSNDIIAIYL